MDDASPLDYAIFHTSSLHNRYDAIVCCKGEREKLLSGPLESLALFLPDAKLIHSNASNSTFKLLLSDDTAEISNFFNKSTLVRFLNAVNSPEVVKSTAAIQHEISHLEETRKFHLSLHSKEQNRLGGISGGFLDSVGMAQQVNAGTVTSEATKNELLRALELRLTALNEELAVVFCSAIGSNITSEELSYLASFVHHFCMPDLRDSICKNLETILNHQSEREPIKRINTTDVFPAKLAQVERENLSESGDEDSSSGDERSETVVERSRPVIRAPSPRRSASPMRRVQIGRSGSRRAQAIAIKSLSYFPGRDKSAFDLNAEESGEEESERANKKTEVNVTRISVKDAISLFECKQKDQVVVGDGNNKKKGFGFVSTNKAVLRRWSSGMGESCTTSQNSSTDLISEKNDIITGTVSERDEKVEEVMKAESGDKPENLPLQEREIEAVESVTTEEMKSQHEGLMSEKALASAEWNRQKEAELNEMLLKMMGTKAGKYGLKPNNNDQKGDLYSQYKEKRDAKLRGENNNNNNNNNTVKRAVKQKVQESVINKPTTIGRKSGVLSKEKKISPIPQQRQLRRNSAPLIAPKKEVSKATTTTTTTTPVSSKKASPRASPLPSTRTSYSVGTTITKSNTSQKNKTGSNALNSSINSKNGGSVLNSSINSKSGGALNLNSSTNSNTPISRRKPQAAVTPSTQPSVKTEKPIKTRKEKTLTDPKLRAKVVKEERTPNTVLAKTNRGTKLKNSSSLADDDSSTPQTKPSLYNKVTKKSSVVPLESKPSIKKRASATTVVASPKDSVKSVRNSHEKEIISRVKTVEEHTEVVPRVDSVPPEINHDNKEEISVNDELHVENLTEAHLEATHGNIIISSEVQTEDDFIDLGISSAAWVEEAANQPEMEMENPVTSEINEQTIEPTVIINSSLSTSPKIRHSLSQMLQADTSEPEIIEWGNAENPPALVFQKDSPKGFKRLLKFARKGGNNNANNISNNNNKGDGNSNGRASPLVFSEGEDDTEEYNKGVVVGKSIGTQSRYLSESFDGGYSNKRGIGSGTMSSDQSSGLSLNSFDKLREGNASSNKASRSFFSLSNFRSNKSNETKPR